MTKKERIKFLLWKERKFGEWELTSKEKKILRKLDKGERERIEFEPMTRELAFQEEKIPKTKEAWLGLFEKKSVPEKLRELRKLQKDEKADKLINRAFEKEQKQYDKIQERIAKKDAKFLDKAISDFAGGKEDWL